MGRNVVTKSTIDDAIAAGRDEVQVAERDIVTALAKEYAQSKGVRLVVGGAPQVSGSTAPQSGEDDVQRAREAIVRALGYEPEGLERIIRKVQQES